MRNKLFLWIFIIPVLILIGTETYQAQTVIREKVTIKPNTTNNNLSVKKEYSPLVITFLGSSLYKYSVSGPVGSVEGTDEGGQIVVESIGAVNGNYSITVTSYYDGNTSVGFSVTWLDPQGNNEWIAGYELWFYGPGDRHASFVFNRIPTDCDFEFSVYPKQLCEANSSSLLDYQTIYSLNCDSDFDVSLSIQPNNADISIIDCLTDASVGTMVNTTLTNLANYRLKLNSRYYGATDEEVIVKVSTKDTIKTDTLKILPCISPLHFVTNAFIQGLETINHNSTAVLVAETKAELCSGYDTPLPDNIKYSAKIIKGMNYGTLLYGDNFELSGDEINDLSHNQGELVLVFSANGDIPERFDTVIVKIFTADANVEPKELQIFIDSGSRMVFDISPSIIAPWESSTIHIRERKGNGEVVDFPPGQLFKINVAEGADFGFLSSPGVIYPDGFQTILPDGMVFYAYEGPADTTRIRIYAETFIDDGSGGAASIKGIKQNEKLYKTNMSETEQKLSGYGEILIVKTGGRLIVSFEKNPISPGETTKIIIDGIDDSGAPIIFPPDQTFSLELWNGIEYGGMSSSSTGQTGDYIENASKEFFFTANDSIDVESASISVYAWTEYESGGGLAKITSRNKHHFRYKPGTMKILKKQHEDEFKFSMGENQSKTTASKDLNSVTASQELTGLGILKIENLDDDCSEAPQCEEDPKKPEMIIVEHNNGTFNQDACAPIYDPQTKTYGYPLGVTRPIEGKNMLDPIHYELCYNNKKNSWQINLDPFKFHIIKDICSNTVQIMKYKVIDNVNLVPKSDVCIALNDILGHLVYPYDLPNGHYTFKNIVLKHEEMHRNSFENILKKYIPDIYNEIKNFRLSCNDASKIEQATSSAHNFIFSKIAGSYLTRALDDWRYEASGGGNKFVRQLNEILNNMEEEVFNLTWNTYLELKSLYPDVNCPNAL